MYPTTSQNPKPTGKRVRSLDQNTQQHQSEIMKPGHISRPNVRSIDSAPYEARRQNRTGSFPATVLPPLNVVKRKPVPIGDEDKAQDTNPPSEEAKHDSKIFQEGKKISQRYDQSAKPQSGYTTPLSLASHNSVGARAEQPSERKPDPDPRKPESPPSVYEQLMEFHRQIMEDVREEEGEPDGEEEEEEEEEMAAASACLDYWRPEFGGHDSTEASKKSSREENTVPDLGCSARDSGGVSRQQLRKDSVLSSPNGLRTRSMPDDARNGRVRIRDKENTATAKQDSRRESTSWWKFE
ncbi:hypothetical protein CBER1_04144 [Cercospora berteroae]|uniref:Uncharacterized protein n=1 Tax=Cercospora berteroae TaxID=357750 RepID=A0A2S6CN15_9PEZI|nr:hypothetical protein CBER1_04144 [Cercospora berteroae]